jgi:hypothetical protein
MTARPEPSLFPLALLLLATCLAIPITARADDDSKVKFDGGGMMIHKPKPGAPDVKAVPDAWPRLDPGAVLCNSEDDLRRLAARRSGQQIDGKIDCRIINNPTAITIVQRQSPGITQVKANGATGWTDVWLPERPPGGTTASR